MHWFYPLVFMVTGCLLIYWAMKMYRIEKAVGEPDSYAGFRCSLYVLIGALTIGCGLAFLFGW